MEIVPPKKSVLQTNNLCWSQCWCFITSLYISTYETRVKVSDFLALPIYFKDFLEYRLITTLFNRPGVAGAVLQSSLSLIHWLSESSFSSKSSKFHKSQTRRARENVHPNNMSHVMCHMSHVTCHVSSVIFLLTNW